MGKLKVVVNDGAREFNQLAVTYPNFSDGSRENSIRHRFCVQLGYAGTQSTNRTRL